MTTYRRESFPSFKNTKRFDPAIPGLQETIYSDSEESSGRVICLWDTWDCSSKEAVKYLHTQFNMQGHRCYCTHDCCGHVSTSRPIFSRVMGGRFFMAVIDFSTNI